jgi:putative ABC transport system substrate-binding protein
MKRRDFITLLGGAAAAWPLAARAQERERVRRIGVLMGYGETDPEAKVLLSEFNQGLAELGWRSGRNLRMDIRWAPGNVDQMPSLAKELVGLQPEVILANSTPVTLALQRETQTIPIDRSCAVLNDAAQTDHWVAFRGSQIPVLMAC